MNSGLLLRGDPPSLGRRPWGDGTELDDLSVFGVNLDLQWKDDAERGQHAGRALSGARSEKEELGLISRMVED